MSFIIPRSIHKYFGVEEIPGIVVDEITESLRKDKKYKITVTYRDVTKEIHFGDLHYDQYKDRTPDKVFEDWNHYNMPRRFSYLARATKIKSKGVLSCNLPFSPNRYSIICLW